MLYATLRWGTHSVPVWRLTPCWARLFTSSNWDHLRENLHSSHKHVYWKKNRYLKLFKHATGKNVRIYKDWQGKESVKEASNQQKLYITLLAWLWRLWKSLNGECVTYVCLSLCSTHKQNHYHFLSKTATTDKCAVSLSYFYNLVVCPITGEHYKLNPSTADKCKLKLWLQM